MRCLPGNSLIRIGYPADLYKPRLEDETYQDQWKAALGTGIQPHRVTITLNNEWHEGSQIEPAAYGMNDGEGYSYADDGTLGDEGYLDLTRRWIDEYLGMDWHTVPEMRVRITTTSGWTSFILNSGGNFARGAVGTLTEEATLAIIGDRVDLNQDLERAVAGGSVEALIDFSILSVETAGTLEVEIQRGNVGWTKVEIYNISGKEPLLMESISWRRIVGGLNSYHFSIPVAKLTETTSP